MDARALLLATIMAATSAQGVEITRVGDLELHCVAVPTMELTPEAAKAYNVVPSPDRGLLTITLFKKIRPGEEKSVQGQIFVGAVNQRNNLSSIPIREVREGDETYYLGEYRVTPPDTLRFLVNANVLGKIMKAEFARAFGAP